MISVVIPAFRARDTIGRALESVSGQTHEDWEIVVAEDGEADGTGSVVAAFAAAIAQTLVHVPLGGHRGTLHFEHGFRDVQMSDVHLGEHIGQQPFAVDRHKHGAAVTFFERIEQAFVDLCAIELVDFLGGEQRVIVEKAISVHLIEPVVALQRCREFAWLAATIEMDFDHLEVAVFWVLTWAHLDHFADRKFHGGKDHLVADSIVALGGIECTFA